MIDRAAVDGRDYEHQYRLLMPNGSEKHVHVTAHAVKDEFGRIEFIGAITDVTAAKETERKLRFSEAYLAETQHLSHTSSWTWDERRKEYVYLSDEIYHLFGVEQGKESELVKTYHNRMLPDDKLRVIEAAQRAIQDKTDFEIDFRIRLPDGKTKHVHSVGHPVLNSEGDLIQLVGTNMDVTEQFEAKQELQKAFDEIKRSQDHLQLVIDAIPILVWRAGPDGIPDFLNQPALDYTGLSSEQAELGWPRAFHPGDKKAMLRKWSAIRESGRPGSLEARLRRFDGVYRWFLFQAEPLRDKSGEIVKWYGSATDIEDRKLAEFALRESEQRFRDYAETASDWLWETGPDHRVASISEHVDFAGIPSSRLPGMTRWDIASDREAEPEKWRRHQETLAAHRPFRDFVYGVINQNGSQVYVRSSGKPLFDANDRFLGYRGTGTDITALIRAEQAEQDLRKAQAELAHVTRVTMLGELTASIAHEVNQPLAAVVANAEASLRWLNREQPDLAAARRSVEWVINDGCRASDVIRRVRALAKKSNMETVRLDLNQVVNEAIALVERELVQHQVSLRTELAPALPEILGDRVQLQQVIINLLMNGIEAMQPVTDRPRELLIRSGKDDTGHLLLSVTDSGIGISAENANRLFNAFFTTKSRGLAWGYRSAARSWKLTAGVCLRQITRAPERRFNSCCLCTGRISDGSALEIDVCNDGTPAARPSSSSKTKSRCGGRSAISSNRWGWKSSCSARRPKCCKASSLMTASCLVLDVRLPGLSGLDFQTELAKANIHIPIIFMSGHGDIPMTVRAMKGGAVDFLTKPFRDQDMLDAVGAAIERDRKRRETERASRICRRVSRP